MSSAPCATLFHNPVTLPPPVGYSHVVQSRGGRLIHVSGQAARNADGVLVGEGDFTAQLQQCFLNIQHALEAVGASMADLVKLNYFCDERVPQVALRSVVVVRDRFVNTARPPASSFVVVKRLVRPEWLIEIEAVAHAAALDGSDE
jgi:enamine deaminase RidA (YjgF/YER057c/UK114 family)